MGFFIKKRGGETKLKQHTSSMAALYRAAQSAWLQVGTISFNQGMQNRPANFRQFAVDVEHVPCC